MAKVKVYAPNKAYGGSTGSARFEAGVAEVDSDAPEMAYFRAAGYGIGKPAGEPEDPEANVEWPDPHTHADESFGSPLRDAAVDPEPGDYLAPINAGEAHPHSSKVVSPGIHGVGPAPIRPGEVFVDDPAKQEAEEKDLAKRVLIDHEPATTVATMQHGEGPLGLSDPGSVAMGTDPDALAAAKAAAGVTRPNNGQSQAMWVDYAVSQGADRAEVEDMKRADLIERYGG